MKQPAGWAAGALALALTMAPAMHAQQMIVSRGAATVMVEPYAENIVRVSISLLKADATAAPGYGISAKPLASGWKIESGAGGDVLRSSRMSVTVAPQQNVTLTGTEADIAKFFNGSTPPVDISIKTADGAPLLEMNDWQMAVPNYKDGTAEILNDRRPSDDPFYQVGATFASPTDEHYYGLGQNHEGYLDRRGHAVRCAHDYNAPAGPERLRSVCGHQQGLRPAVGQPRQDHRAVRLQRGDPVDLGRGPARVVLRHRGQDVRRDLRGLQPADRRRADAAQVGVWLHPVQAAIHQPGRADGRGQGLSRPPSARGRAGDRLVPLHQDGRDGHGSREVARPRRHEPRAARHELPHHDQRLAALHSRGPLLQDCPRQRMVPASGRRHAHQWSALRPRRLGHRHHQSRCREVVLGRDTRQLRCQGLRRLLGRRDRARSAAQRQLLPRRPGHGVLQRLPALPHRRVLQRNAPRHERARADPCARRVSRRAAQRRNLLVVGHLPHLGHAEAAGSHGHQLRRQRHALLEHRHRRLAVSSGDAQARRVRR